MGNHSQKKRSLEQMVRQRVYQMTAGYEDCNDGDYLRDNPGLRLAFGPGHECGANQSTLSQLENDIVGTAPGQEAFNAMIIRSAEAPLKWKNKHPPTLDVDSADDRAHGKQE